MSDSPQPMNSLDCWDYTIELECLQGTEDLQLAAELGKTLLERNKELETLIKQYQCVNDDQAQEIEYLTKQTTALREVNDSRLRIYEQLEVSIQDLERANHRLSIDCANEKKHARTLIANLESSETKNDELHAKLQEAKRALDDTQKQLQQRKDCATPVKPSKVIAKYIKTHSDDEEAITPVSEHKNYLSCIAAPRTQETQTLPCADDGSSAQVAQLLTQLSETNAQAVIDCRRITELEDHVQALVQQNQELETQIINVQHKDCDMKSMQDEISILEEVRQGQLCSKCLRSAEEMSSVGDRDEDGSLMDTMTLETHRSSFYMEVQEYGKTSTPPKPNDLFKDFKEKYEVLKKVQEETPPNRYKTAGINLQEELATSGDFNALHLKDTDEESGHGDSLKPELGKKVHKTFSQTPTDFSEAETSSSGFADETSNKSTQTDRFGPLLCKIGEGETCFSIYDQANNIDGRFRHHPELRKLFHDIFRVLKKAEEQKDEKPIACDDPLKTSSPKVPPLAACSESTPDLPDAGTDDSQSVLSSTMSELSASQTDPGPIVETPRRNESQDPVLRPLVRPPLEALNETPKSRKRSTSRKKRQFQERSDSPRTHILSSPTIKHVSKSSSGRKGRKGREAIVNNENSTESQWNGNTMHFHAKGLTSPTPSQGNVEAFEPSSALKKLVMLKAIDRSYRDVVLGNHSAKQRENNQRGRRK